MFRDKGFRKSAPLEEGQELDVTIEAVGEKGDGIAKSKGFVIFVPGVKQGDQVRVRVTKVLRNFSFGEVVGAASAGSTEPASTGKKRRSEESSEEGAGEGTEGNGDDDFDENEDEDKDEDSDKERTEE